jgi:hypothetical protein
MMNLNNGALSILFAGVPTLVGVSRSDAGTIRLTFDGAVGCEAGAASPFVIIGRDLSTPFRINSPIANPMLQETFGLDDVTALYVGDLLTADVGDGLVETMRIEAINAANSTVTVTRAVAGTQAVELTTGLGLHLAGRRRWTGGTLTHASPCVLEISQPVLSYDARVHDCVYVQRSGTIISTPLGSVINGELYLIPVTF